MNKHFTPPQQNIKDNQNTLYLNRIRLLASFFVVVLHVCGGFFYSYPITSYPWMFPTFLNCLVRTAVPLFVMIGGAIYLNEEKQITLKKIFSTMLKFVVIFFLWNFIYFFIDYGVIYNFSNITKIFESILNYKYHLWYLLDYIAVLAFVPVLRLICKRENRKQVKYLIVVFFICTCCIAMFNNFISLFDSSNLVVCVFQYISKVLNMFNFGKIFAFFILFITGWYFSTFDFEHRLKLIRIAKWIVGLLAPVIIILLCVFVNVNMFDLIASYYYLPNYILSVCIFLTFRYSKVANKPNLFVDYSTKLSFGIYLSHALLLGIVFKLIEPCFSQYYNSLWILLIIPLYIVITYSISFGFAALINLLPKKIKKWIC